MVNLLKSLIRFFVRSNSFYKLFNATIIPFANFIQRENIINELCSDRTVRQGIFKGMKYPEMKSVGSALFPKLLGTYENELEELLKKICLNTYSEIIDIGCAEGYYAIGLAIKIPTAKIYAYDVDPEAIRLWQNMAHINNVSSRLTIGSFCDTETLKSIPFSNKALIICDCEGYELDLFTKDAAVSIKKHELIIEIHDFINQNISQYIREIFKDTHEIDEISSIDCFSKARQYDYRSNDERFCLATMRYLLNEGRPANMKWFYLKPRY